MSAVDLISLLSKSSFFEGINYPLHDLVGKLSLGRFSRGKNIFKEGEESNCLYLIISGRVQIYSMSAAGKEVLIQVLEKTDFFGEMSLLDGGNRSASARAVEETIVFRLYQKDFMEILNNYPQVALKINQTLSKRLRQANARIKILNGANSLTTDQELEIGEVDEENIDINEQDAAKEKEFINEQDVVNEKEVVIEDQLKQEVLKALYPAKIVCPICSTKFESTRVRSSSVRVGKIDSDFCKHYESANPLYYEIMVCPQCGFAFDLDLSKMHMNAKQRERLSLRLQPVWRDRAKDYSGVRTLKDALETFQLTLFALEEEPVKNSKKGMLYLKTAWLYRYAGDEAKERMHIEKAITSFALAYEKESFSDPKSEFNIVYLLGTLNLMTDKNQESAKWLDRVLRHPAKSMQPLVVNQARDLWAEVRRKIKEEEQA